MPKILLFGRKIVLALGFYKDFLKEVKDLKDVCKQIVKERKEVYIKNNRKPNMNSIELYLRHLDDNPEEYFSEEELIDNCFFFIIAGTDTTTHTLESTIYELHKNPQYIPKLREEIEKYYRIGPDYNIDDLQKMDYMHATLIECTRLHPVLGFTAGKLALQDHMIGDIKVRKGTYVRTDMIHKHLNEDIFKDPYTFNPERFFNGNGPKHPMGYMGFNSGQNSCAGRGFAMHAMKIALSHFLQRYKSFEVTQGYEKYSQSIIYGSGNPVLANLEKY